MRKRICWTGSCLLGLIAALTVVACGGAKQTPTLVPSPGIAATATSPGQGSASAGKELWAQAQCPLCHGAQAEGGIGSTLAGTPLTFDEFTYFVRVGKGVMPPYTTSQISDAQVRAMYDWLESLPPLPTVSPALTATATYTATFTVTPPPTVTATFPAPTAQVIPTPAPTLTPAPTRTPLPPSGHLLAMWEAVNTVKVRSDYAKDASPDINTLHGYAGDAQVAAQTALSEAALTLVDIPNPTVQTTVKEVEAAVNLILGHISAALATNDLNVAHNEAAQMATISRLQAWPLATLAVKEAGFVGSVRVLVTDQSGRPIRGALVYALTAPNPAAGITGSDGRATLYNLAAVRLMLVKAFQSGGIYHEIDVTIPTGGMVAAQITLIGTASADAAPVVTNPSITPATGPGNAQVVFQMTATDPQGHDDIAPDQVLAMNPGLGVGYVLLTAGGDTWSQSVTLPGLAPGTYTWYFFAVDHQCNTSSIIPLTYTVP